MLAAETIFDALLASDFSASTLQRFQSRVKESWITPELRRYRNFHAAFRHGRWLGMRMRIASTSPAAAPGEFSTVIIRSPDMK